MKPSQQLAAVAVAGLCGTALSLPQIPFYTSRFPQHPQNLGYSSDYPKYWQGEAYSPPQEDASYYGSSLSSPSAPAPVIEGRPSFIERKYPAREAIKYYGGNQFPVNEEEAFDELDKNVQNVKIKSDTPAGDNGKTFTRIAKSPGVGGINKKKKAAPEIEEEPEEKSGGLESIADIAVPEFNGAVEIAEDKDREEEGEPENWNSFTFGVVSDTLVYHDPYENREGGFERKTNAMEKIELMMGREYSGKDAAEVRRSLGKRDWPEHIQEKALKMMNSATNMQTKGQKTIDNDPAYQESLKAKNPAPEPVAPPKSTFPVAPKSKNPQQAPPKQPQNNQPPVQPQPQPKKKPVGSGGGDFIPSGKSGKLGRAKKQPPSPPPQAPQNQPLQQQQPPRSQKAARPPSDPNQPRQPGHKQPNQPNGSMGKNTGNSKQPQQGNFPSQGSSRKGSGLNTPNQRPQGGQKKPAQNGKKPQQKPQQKPQNKLHKRQVPVPAGPEYPPGTMIVRRPYVPAQNAAQNIQPAVASSFVGQISGGQPQGQTPPLQQISDGQIQRQEAQQAVPIPAPAPFPVSFSVPVPVVIQQTVAPVVEKTETVQFAAIVHPGKVICPENKPCPQPEPEYIEKTVLQPVQKLREIPVTREGIRAVPGFEAVDVVREVDVVKEMQVEKQVLRQPVCESCERARPKTITVCAECREAADECSCYGDNGNKGKEATRYGGPGPISGPSGLEAFFRQRMPEHFDH